MFVLQTSQHGHQVSTENYRTLDKINALTLSLAQARSINTSGVKIITR